LHKIFSLQPHRSSYINGFNFNPATLPPIFFNSNVDTIWIDPYNHYPDGELIPYLRRYSCYGQKTTSIRKLAIGYETWHRMMLFGMGNGDLKSMQHLAEMGTEEVFLIVGDTVKNAAKSPDIVLIRPRAAPSKVINPHSIFEPVTTVEIEQKTWDMMDAAATNYITEYQAQRDEDRSQYADEEDVPKIAAWYLFRGSQYRDLEI
jgi:hypothetical protein